MPLPSGAKWAALVANDAADVSRCRIISGVTHAKNQHYVSRLYLRQFAYQAGKNPHIYAFDKTARRVIRPSIKNVATELHFYEASDTGVERALGRLEDMFVPAYRAVREIDDIATLGLEERVAIALFIAVQQVRTVEFRATLKSMVSGLDEWGKHHNHHLDESYTTITEDQCRCIQLASLATTAPAIATGAAEMKWIRLHNRTDMPFWASDHPVTHYNPKPAGLMGNLGWACPGIQVFFPLSPTLALCICDPDEYRAIPSEVSINETQQITLQNYLQLLYATRFVFSSSGDFELATKVLDANPEMGDPARKRASWRGSPSERRGARAS